MVILEYGVAIVGIYVSLYVAYCILISVANFVIKNNIITSASPQTRFGVVIPAHNEEDLLPRLLISLDGQEYPAELVDVFVIADNCTDRTCEVASTFRAKVLKRIDKDLVGKGYAIHFAFENIELDKYDAVFIVDADSVLERKALKNLDAVVQEGKEVVQCSNGVANPEDSWFTCLLDVSRTIANEIFEPGKEKLGLSSHLMGNGMCLCKEVIAKHGWGAFSVGEDWEYYARLIEQGGRVAFAKEVRVFHQESNTLRQATPQRMRWASGRLAIAYKHGLTLFLRGLIKGNLRKMDASLPLLFPNPSMGVNLNLVLLFFSFFLSRPFYIYWFLSTLILQSLMFCVGIALTRNPSRKFLAMFMAPTFLAWKMIIDFFSVLGFGRRHWVRTERYGQRQKP
jgi:cellulose synthase/poly-beta-1,6-N-acetylglucosamine synthase-like glycosyltransferase